MHIADIDYVDFFRHAFDDPTQAAKHIKAIEAVSPDHCKAKIVIHQAARMLWLADRIDEVARGRPALQVFFYLVAAEAIAKIFVGFDKEGESRKHVHMFFEKLCNDDHRSVLGKTFTGSSGLLPVEGEVSTGWLSVPEAVDKLYDIRCDVVHKGEYFDFALPDSDGAFPMTVRKYDVTGHVTISRIRRIVLEGALGTARKMLDQYKKR